MPRLPLTLSLYALILPAALLAGCSKAGGSGARDPAAEKDVLAAMESWKQAMLKKDRAAFDRVLHPDLSYGHSSGLIETRAQAIQHVTTSAATYDAINFADTQVRVHGDTALVTGKVELHQRSHEKVNVVNLVVLSVWAKTPQGWQMIARQSTRPRAP